MSDEPQGAVEEEENSTPTVEQNALEMITALKKEAASLGVKFHPKFGISKLEEKIRQAKQDGFTASVEKNKEAEAVPLPKPIKPIKTMPHNTIVHAKPPVNESKQQRNTRLRKEASRLVRVRVTCMNPNKRDWEGEMYSVGNAAVGFHKKFVPFNATDGWHVPFIIYRHMLDRKCQVFYNAPGLRPGDKIRKGKLINELSVELLPPLTKEEVAELRTQQAMANNIDSAE